MAIQANLQPELGDAYLMKAKGNFDPKIAANAQQKYFKGDQYYSIMNAGLKVPTWFGVSFEGGYDITNGSQLNAERLLPDDGLWYAGIKVALGRGLIIDQRRAELKKARVYAESSLQQQKIMLNELYVNSANVYWNWFKAYNKMKVYERAVQNAFERLKGIKQSAQLGDKADIDTLEASIQLQNRMFSYLDTELDYANSTAMLEIYLWDNGFVPLEVDSTLSPPLSEFIQTTTVAPEIYLELDSIKQNHPEVLYTQFKIDQRAVDLKLSKENLKPTLNLKYNAITEVANGGLANNYSINNYTWGADFAFPIFLRKERAQLKLEKLRIQSLESDLAFKTEQVAFKIEAALNAWATTYKQIQIWRSTTAGYEQLLESEKTLFTIGESSLFMINSREKAFITAQLDLIEKLTENKKSEIKARYAMGTLHSNY